MATDTCSIFFADGYRNPDPMTRFLKMNEIFMNRLRDGEYSYVKYQECKLKDGIMGEFIAETQEKEPKGLF